MSAAGTRSERLPIDDACAPRADALGEPRHESLLEMALKGIGAEDYRPQLPEMGNHLRAAVNFGRRIHRRRIESERGFRLGGVLEARRYRLYLAWSRGLISGCIGIIEAEQSVGIRDEHGNVTETWR